MKSFDERWTMEGVARRMVRKAQGYRFHGYMHEAWLVLDELKAIHEPTRSVLIYSYDEGMHSLGWFKNPDYERCKHLSVHFAESAIIQTESWAPYEKDTADLWLDAFFGQEKRSLWCEPFQRGEGFHYRLFCDERWNGIVPHGEVYSKEFTEKGWKSFSELHGGGEDPKSLYNYETK